MSPEDDISLGSSRYDAGNARLQVLRVEAAHKSVREMTSADVWLILPRHCAGTAIPPWKRRIPFDLRSKARSGPVSTEVGDDSGILRCRSFLLRASVSGLCSVSAAFLLPPASAVSDRGGPGCAPVNSWPETDVALLRHAWPRRASLLNGGRVVLHVWPGRGGLALRDPHLLRSRIIRCVLPRIASTRLQRCLGQALAPKLLLCACTIVDLHSGGALARPSCPSAPGLGSG